MVDREMEKIDRSIIDLFKNIIRITNANGSLVYNMSVYETDLTHLLKKKMKRYREFLSEKERISMERFMNGLEYMLERNQSILCDAQILQKTIKSIDYGNKNKKADVEDYLECVEYLIREQINKQINVIMENI